MPGASKTWVAPKSPTLWQEMQAKPPEVPMSLWPTLANSASGASSAAVIGANPCAVAKPWPRNAAWVGKAGIRDSSHGRGFQDSDPPMKRLAHSGLSLPPRSSQAGKPSNFPWHSRQLRDTDWRSRKSAAVCRVSEERSVRPKAASAWRSAEERV